MSMVRATTNFTLDKLGVICYGGYNGHWPSDNYIAKEIAMDDDVQALTDHATALGRVRAAMSICQTIEMAEGCKPPFCAQAETCDLVFRYTALHGLVTERQSRLREELDRDDGYSTGYDDGYGAAQGEREDEI